MTWQLLAFSSVLIVSVATLLERVLMKENKSDPIGYAIIFQFLLGFIALGLAFIFHRFTPPPIKEMPINFLISSILWAGSTVFSFKAIKQLQAGEASILSSTATLISIVLGIILLHEPITKTLILGTLFIFTAIWLVTYKKNSFQSKQGIKYILIAACCSGIAVVNDAYILQTYEAFSYTAIMSFLPGLVLLPFYFKNALKVLSTSTKPFVLLMVLFCFLYALQALTYYLAFELKAPVSLLSPIVRSSVVVTVILGAVFLKERDNIGKKLVAAVIMMIGVILLG